MDPVTEEQGPEEYVHCGYMTKCGSTIKSWKKRYFALNKQGFLMYFRDANNMDSPLGRIDITTSMDFVPPHKCAWAQGFAPKEAHEKSRFEIKSPTRTFYLFCDCASDVEEWLVHLHTLKAESMKRRNSVASMDVSGGEVGDDIYESALHFGWITKCGLKIKSWKRRFFVLDRQGMLVYAKDERSLDMPLGVIDLRRCQKITPDPECQWTGPKAASNKNRFELICDYRTYRFYCDTEQEASDWVASIESALLFCCLVNEGDESEKVSGFDKDDEEISLHEGESTITEDDGMSVRASMSSHASASSLQQPSAPPSPDKGDARSAEAEGAEGGKKDAGEAEDTKQQQQREADGETSAEAGDEEDAPVLTEAEQAEVATVLSDLNLPSTPERLKSFSQATRIGRNRVVKHVTIIYNPVSGAGTAKRVVYQHVVPILRLAKITFAILETQYQGHATKFTSEMDLSSSDGILVAGGDGMVCEVITGLMSRTDGAADKMPLGIIPVGTANAMANELDAGNSKTQMALVNRAVLAVASGVTRKVDLLRVTTSDKTSYGLSCIGWGLAGAVALRAAKLRWIKGQKKARYDIAGFLTLMTEWPVVCPCTFSYPTEVKNAETGETETVWKEEKISITNMIASNLSKLGSAHAIMKTIQPDDGHMCVAIIPGGVSRNRTVSAGLHMKQGGYLSEHKEVQSYVVTEFKIVPDAGSPGAKIPFNMDGDPMDGGSSIHAQILHQKIRVFAHPPQRHTFSPIKK